MFYNEPAFLLESLVRLLVASGLGAVVGLERELKQKPAGLRTIILITFGATLFTILSEALARGTPADPTRIAAQLLTGVGFLGAGSIIQSRHAVTGLTTAATIFAMASVGMAAGGGLLVLAIVSTGLLLIVLVVLGWVETKTEIKVQPILCTLNSRQPAACVDRVQAFARQNNITLRDVAIHRRDGDCRVEFVIEAPGGREADVLGAVEEIQAQCS